jgi:uncharacterized pyridoxamine 5'-phosphate oxidase family protein
VKLPEQVVQFFSSQNFVIVSTVDETGGPHSSCKGIFRIEEDGTVYLLDLYKGRTSKNLKQNPNASITAVDEHKFRGWCLKGTARIINGDELPSGVLAEWKKKITGRITHRLIKNMHGEKGHPLHPEAQLPKPEYLIEMVVKEIVNLTPSTLKK